MNLAPLLAELAGLRALPSGLLRPLQRERLETVRAALALAQHILPGGQDELPRIRVESDEGVAEGRVLSFADQRALFRLAKGSCAGEAGVALIHFTDGRPPLAVRGRITAGPTPGYWKLESLDGSLDPSPEQGGQRGGSRARGLDRIAL
ncbi:MAG: hypothetical protein P1V51_02635 [Deltaproteobacteria bacterium]|nr:hypothetical protein [Deltaproteobacteria bacterium]